MRKFLRTHSIGIAFLLIGVAIDVMLYHIIGSPFGVTFGILAGVVTGTEGSDATGSQYKELGPATVYFGKKTSTQPNLTGTITAAATTTVTGTGTQFTTELAVGDWILPATMTNPVQVKSIASNTSLVVQGSAITVTGDTFKKAIQTYLGYNEAVTLKYGLTKTGMKSAQEGTNDADAAVTGYKCEVEFGMVAATPSRKAKVLQGWKLNRDTSTGLIKGQAFTFPIGQLDSNVWDELRIVRWRGGAESSAAMDTILITRAAPVADSEAKFDASTQMIFKTMFKGYVDDTVLFGGAPVIMSMGDLS